jgi:hypothetical protein
MPIVFKNSEAHKKDRLIEKINYLIDVPIDDSCIFFATEDKNHIQIWQPDNYDDKYGLQGFYVNLEKDDGKIPDPYPEEITSIFSILGQSKHFIWISKNISEAEDIHFAWVYSHELQHLKQSLQNPYLLILSELLNVIEYEVREVDMPTEFDCEKKAKEIVINIFGEDECVSYLRKMKNISADNDNRYRKLLELNIMDNFDVEKAMQQDICNNKNIIKNSQKQMQNDDITKWKIDIDKICSCINSHEAIISAMTKI